MEESEGGGHGDEELAEYFCNELLKGEIAQPLKKTRKEYRWHASKLLPPPLPPIEPLLPPVPEKGGPMKTVKQIIANWPHTWHLHQLQLLPRSTYYDRRTIMQEYWRLGEQSFWHLYGGLSVTECLRSIREGRRSFGVDARLCEAAELADLLWES